MINNYEELLIERKKIERTIAEEKRILNEGFDDLKEKVEPFINLLSVLNVFKKKSPNNSLLNFVAAMGIDLFIGKKLLANSSWFTRIIIPIVLKGVSSIALGRRTPKNNVNNSKQITEPRIT